MWLIDELAEQYILQALERGELDNLPGTGRPLVLDDDRLVPEELRAGYRLLKNAGYLPPEVDAMREIRQVEALLAQATDPQVHTHAARRLGLLQTRLSEGRGRGLGVAVQRQYSERLLESLTSSPRKPDTGGSSDVGP